MRAATLAGDAIVPYEHLVLACGDGRLDLMAGMQQNALPLKTVGDAMHIRNSVLRHVV